jgi:hypothetical protein
METIKGLSSFVSELKAKRISLANELQHVDESLAALGKFSLASNHAAEGSTGSADTKAKRIISAASRRKMALAQKARWANLRQSSQPTAVAKSTSTAATKRKISAAGRQRIAAATRERWAKFRAAKKKAA